MLDLQKVLNVLGVLGGVVLVIPALLHAALAVCKLIPGDSPDRAVEKLLGWSEKLAALVTKVMPQKPAQVMASEVSEAPKE